MGLTTDYLIRKIHNNRWELLKKRSHLAQWMHMQDFKRYGLAAKHAKSIEDDIDQTIP